MGRLCRRQEELEVIAAGPDQSGQRPSPPRGVDVDIPFVALEASGQSFGGDLKFPSRLPQAATPIPADELPTIFDEYRQAEWSESSVSEGDRGGAVHYEEVREDSWAGRSAWSGGGEGQHGYRAGAGGVSGAHQVVNREAV